jgi:hypothetical protein
MAKKTPYQQLATELRAAVREGIIEAMHHDRVRAAISLPVVEPPKIEAPPTRWNGGRNANGVPVGKRIESHTTEELTAAIEQAVAVCDEQGLPFYKLLHGIDAYIERRRRRRAWAGVLKKRDES